MLLSWILSSQARKDAIFIRSMVSRWWGDIGSDTEKGCAGGKIYGKAHKSKHTSCAEKSCYYWMQNDPIHLNVKCEIWLLNGWFSCIFLNIRNWIYGHECGKVFSCMEIFNEKFISNINPEGERHWNIWYGDNVISFCGTKKVFLGSRKAQLLWRKCAIWQA